MQPSRFIIVMRCPVFRSRARAPSLIFEALYSIGWVRLLTERLL